MSRQNEFFAFSAHPTYGANRLITFIILISGANLSAKIKSCSLFTSTTFLSSFNFQPHIFYLFSLCTTFMLYPFSVSFALSTFHSPPTHTHNIHFLFPIIVENVSPTTPYFCLLSILYSTWQLVTSKCSSSRF